MRLVPRTLAARMSVILLLGLVLTELLSIAINALDRGRAFYSSTTLQVAEHISDIAKALDAVRPAERSKIVGALGGRRLTIELSHGPDITESVSKRPYARAFQAMLRRRLGRDWRVHVLIHGVKRRAANREPFFWDTPVNALDRYLTLRWLYLAPRGFAFVAHVRLHDGSWVTFAAPLPYEHIERLYILLPKLVLMLAILIGLLLFAVRWVTRPLKRMAQAALALGRDLEPMPFEEKGPEEVRAAARALNVMQRRLQEHVRERTAMLATLSHDLRTFITRLRLRSEFLPKSQHRDRLVGDLGDMATMVNATLEYLNGVNSDPGRAQFDVTALVESIRTDAEDMGWTVTVCGTGRGPFCGNVQDLRRCLMNLVENAVKYGGEAAISLEDNPRELTIAVCDPGPGIPPEERERVFEPFYRGRTSRNSTVAGTGLGLNIARTIARAHGGDVVLEQDSGRGFCAVLRLPRLARAGSARSPRIKARFDVGTDRKL